VKKVIIFISLFLISIAVFSVDIDFYNVSLKEAIETLAGDAGVNIIVGPEVKGTVNLSVRSLSVESALDLMLYNTIYDYEKVEEGIYVVGALDSSSNIAIFLNKPEVIKLKYITTDNIKNVLDIYSERAKYIEGTDFVVIYGEDFLSAKIKENIKKLDQLGKGYILLYNIYEVSESSYVAIQNLNNYDFPIKFSNSIKFINKNFTRLTTLRQTGFIETVNYASFSFTNSYNSINFDISIDGSNYEIKTELKENDNVIQNLKASANIGDKIFSAFFIGGKYYLINTIVEEKNETSLMNQQDVFMKVNAGLNYASYGNKFSYFFGSEINQSYVEFESDFSKIFSVFYKSNILSDMTGNLKVYNKVNDSKIYGYLSVSESENFDPFSMNGEFGIISSFTLLNSQINPYFNGFFYKSGLNWNFVKNYDFIKSIDFGGMVDISYDLSNFFIKPEVYININAEIMKSNFIFELKTDNYFNVNLKSYINIQF